MRPLHLPVAIPRHHGEQGITLIVVMVMLILGSILVLGSTRTTWFNEILVGNESDYSRAYAAAEALIRDAEADIRGKDPLTGQPFNPGDVAGVFYAKSARPAAGPYFPYSISEWAAFKAPILAAGGVPCLNGICVPTRESGLGANWWTNAATLNTMIARAATYGQFTRAHLATPSLITGNPILNTAAPSGWYWVEVFKYAAGDTIPEGLPVPDLSTRPFLFRITAIARGLKPGTQVVLRTVFVPQPVDETQ
jgi:type IV pilus assembly protein PilX